MRCAIYARAATRPESDAQLLELRAYVERCGWPPAVEYFDMGASTRPQLAKLMDAARRHEFDRVLVWTLDRWGRDLANCLASIEELQQLHIAWSAVSQSGVDTDSIDWIEALCGFLKEQKRERIKASMRLAKRRDLTIGRPRRVFDRERVHMLHLAGKSIRAIAAELGLGRGTVERLVRVPKG